MEEWGNGNGNGTMWRFRSFGAYTPEATATTQMGGWEICWYCRCFIWPPFILNGRRSTMPKNHPTSGSKKKKRSSASSAVLQSAKKKSVFPAAMASVEDSKMLYSSAVDGLSKDEESGQSYHTFGPYGQEEFNQELGVLLDLSNSLAELSPQFRAPLEEVTTSEGDDEPASSIVLNFLKNKEEFRSGMRLLNDCSIFIVDFLKFAAVQSEEKPTPQFFCTFEKGDGKGEELAKSNLLQSYLVSRKSFLLSGFVLLHVHFFRFFFSGWKLVSHHRFPSFLVLYFWFGFSCLCPCHLHPPFNFFFAGLRQGPC